MSAGLALLVLSLTLVPTRAGSTAPGLLCSPGDLVYTRISHTTGLGYRTPEAAADAFLRGYPTLDRAAIEKASGSHFVLTQGGTTGAILTARRLHDAWNITRLDACNALLAPGAVMPTLAGEDDDDDDEKPSPFYQATWRGDLDIEWRFTEGFPSGRMRNVVRKAAAQWNALGEPMQFVFDPEAEDHESYPPSSCPGNNETGKNGIHWGHLDAGGAYTIVCRYTDPDGTSSGRMHSFQIKFASNTGWYTGSKYPPWGKEDFLSYAVHEFGHATGRITGGDDNGHFKDSSRKRCAPKAKVHHTMCQTAPNRSTFDRSLNKGDRKEFQKSY